MPNEQRRWERVYRLDAIVGLGSTMISGVATVIAALSASSTSLTSWVWLVTFFGGTLAIALAFGIGTWAWAVLSGRPKADESNKAPGLAVKAATPEPDPDCNGPAPISFLVEGTWLNTPFACQSLGSNERGEPLYAEDLNLTLIARKLLENVRLIITIKDTEESRPPIIYHHQGMISGTVTPGMRESLRIFRRMFCLSNVRLSNGDEHVHTRQRQDVGVSFLDDISEQSVPSHEIYNVEIALHHRHGQERCSFNLDLRPIEAPRSRLVVKRGELHLKIPNNYDAPTFPPTVCTSH